MSHSQADRRRFLAYFRRRRRRPDGSLLFTSQRAVGADSESKNDRQLVGCIGTGDRWKGLYKGMLPHGDIVAVCDVDRKHAETGKETVAAARPTSTRTIASCSIARTSTS